MVEDYELIPHKVLHELKDEVEALKEKLSQPETPSEQLTEGMNDLRTSIDTMQQVFMTAIDYMKSDDEGFSVGKTLQKLGDKLESIELQNKQIAKGIVTVADMLEEHRMTHKAPAMPPPKMPPRNGSFGPPPRPTPTGIGPDVGDPFGPDLGNPMQPGPSQVRPGMSAPPIAGAPPPPPSASPAGKKGLFDQMFASK